MTPNKTLGYYFVNLVSSLGPGVKYHLNRI